jgi:excinuclease ABC subunit C
MPSEKELLSLAKKLPDRPGCYLMKNTRGEVIYVGKAKRLKDRVSSYFRTQKGSVKTQYLVSHIKEFEFIITESEVESLILENNLIKQYTPKYNIRLKDDKTYPYITFEKAADYPRFIYTRKPKYNGKWIVLGPFPDAGLIKNVSKSIQKLFLLRDCNDFEFKQAKEPCLLYQLKQCSAPCVDFDSRQDYLARFNQAASFFDNIESAEKITKDFEQLMFEKAEKEDFEQAAAIRDLILPFKDYLNYYQEQVVERRDGASDFDVIGVYCENKELDFVVFHIRQSMVIGSKSFHFYLDERFMDANYLKQVALNLFCQYYNKPEKLPDEVWFSDEFLEQPVIEQYLGTRYPKKTVRCFQNSIENEKLLLMAKSNAQENFNYRRKQIFSPLKGLEKLKALLGLKDTPKTLECYDVAIWQGKSPTAAQIVFSDGLPDKEHYRHYHLKELKEGNNDFAMMQEVLSRRIKKGHFPDVFIVDGGKGQLSIFLKVLRENSLSIPVIALAKEKVKKGDHFEKSQERIFLEGRKDPISLEQHPHLKKVLVHMRDESHRFSRRLHHKQEKKRFFNQS